MLTLFKKCLCFVTVLCVFCGLAQAKPKSPIARELFVQKIITEWMQANTVPGVAVVILENEKAYPYFFGFANVGTQQPITKKTIFEIGSLTELYTGLLLATQLYTDQVKLTDTIATVMPDFVAPKPTSPFSTITLMQLATQTSGLPAAIPEDVSSKAALASYFSTWNPTLPIGSQWQNSGVNFGLLGFALEAMTNQTYNSLLRSSILAPLRMKDIGIYVDPGSRDDYAQGYDAQGQAVPINNQEKLFPAAIDAKMSVGDMGKFIALALGLPEIPVPLIKAMRIAQTAYASNSSDEQLGLGWEIYPVTRENIGHLLYAMNEPGGEPLSAQPLEKSAQKWDSKALLEKIGVTAGFSAYIGLVPQYKTGVMIFANRALPADEIAKIGRSLLFNIIETPSKS